MKGQSHQFSFIAKDFKFTGHYDHYFISSDESHYVGNGWEVEIFPNRTVRAIASRTYSDGENTVILTVKRNGFARFIRITPDYAGGFRKETVWRKMIRGWNGNGTLILSGGNITGRYASVRTEAYAEFLRSHGLTQIKFINSYDELVGTGHHAEYSGAGESWYVVYSDGKVSVNYNDNTPDDWNSSLSRGRYEIEAVTEATWVIVKEGMHLRDNHNGAVTLYLLKGTDLFKADIPDAEQRQAYIQR